MEVFDKSERTTFVTELLTRTPTYGKASSFAPENSNNNKLWITKGCSKSNILSIPPTLQRVLLQLSYENSSQL